MLAATFDIGAYVIGAAAVLLSAVFGYPAYKLAKAQVAVDEVNKTASAVARILTGDDDITKVRTDESHPSIRDLMIEIRDANNEQSVITSVVVHHLEDGHGGRVPLDVWRRFQAGR